MATLTVARVARASGVKLGKYRIRLKVLAADREDAWDLCRLVRHYGAVEVCDCCFVFANEAQRSAASEALRFRFGPEYFEEVDMAERSGDARLLIVVREEEPREKCCRHLAQHGFLISEADNGVECMEVLRSWRPDAVVLRDDIFWGGSDGVLERMRQDAELATIPVVLIANRTSGENDVMSRPSAAVACLCEPIVLDHLFNTIQSAVS